MGFGGTVPIGNLIAGPLIEATSVTTVVLAGAAVAYLIVSVFEGAENGSFTPESRRSAEAVGG